ncbi:cytochrome P450 [Rhodococcus erythropolis]|uniref:cytochrome P450 n=1 Tax=Rhodococcus erythropolis TaxID=1833 RepID=UPI002948E363|nr:cytochrome P450 [Rhodococcus erythropolis]MDV6278169.1 cytochrome P450 [Rhodococcus erythropolis]
MTSQTRTLIDGQPYHADPYPLFAELTASGSIHPIDFPAVRAWLITGHNAAKRALIDPRLGKDHRRANLNFLANASIMPEPQHSQLQVHLLHRDPPRHSLMRPLVSAHFTAHRSENQRIDVRADVDALIDALPTAAVDEPVDLVAEFASKLPMLVLARVIGLSDDLRDRFDPAWRTVVAPVPPGHPGRLRYERLLTELQHYIAEVVDTATASTIIGTIAAAAATGDITPPERDSMIFQLFAAGQDPVAAQLELALIALFDHRNVLRRLIREPDLMARAVEELLRFDSAFNLATWRFLDREDSIDGTEVPAGDSVIVALGAANRDPEIFECPHTLRIDRDPNPHLAFGYGRHACPAAALARIEIREALTALLTRLDGLRPGYRPGGLDWSPSPITRAVAALPVHYRQREARA